MFVFYFIILVHFFSIYPVATQAILGGKNIKSVSSILGHSQTSTTMNIYSHSTQKSDTEVFDFIAEQIFDNQSTDTKTA